MAVRTAKIKELKHAGAVITIKFGKDTREITDADLADVLKRAYMLYSVMQELKEEYDEEKKRLISKARTYIGDKGTITFVHSGIEVKITFQHEVIIPNDKVEQLKKLLGERFNDLVKTKTIYYATANLIDMAVDADRGKEIAECIIVKEKGVQIKWKEQEK